MKMLWVVACKFQRTARGKWEAGIAIGAIQGLSDIQSIIDMGGQVIKEPHSYDLRPTDLSVNFLPPSYPDTYPDTDL